MTFLRTFLPGLAIGVGLAVASAASAAGGGGSTGSAGGGGGSGGGGGGHGGGGTTSFSSGGFGGGHSGGGSGGQMGRATFNSMGGFGRPSGMISPSGPSSSDGGTTSRAGRMSWGGSRGGGFGTGHGNRMVFRGFVGGSEARGWGWRHHHGRRFFGFSGSEWIDDDSGVEWLATGATGGFQGLTPTTAQEAPSGFAGELPPPPRQPHEPVSVKLEGSGSNLRVRVECSADEVAQVPADGLVARCVSRDAAVNSGS